MQIEPFDLRLIVDRIAAQCKADAGYHLVDYAADQATAIAARSFVMPAAFVLESSYSADLEGQNASSGLIHVPHDYEIGVLTVVQNFGGAGGKPQSETARALRVSLWNALLGWSPEAEGFPLDLARGQLLDFDDTCFWYLDVFNLKRIVRNVL